MAFNPPAQSLRMTTCESRMIRPPTERCVESPNHSDPFIWQRPARVSAQRRRHYNPDNRRDSEIPSPSANKDRLSMEMLRFPRSTSARKLLSNPVLSARITWVHPRCFRTLRSRLPSWIKSSSAIPTYGGVSLIHYKTCLRNILLTPWSAPSKLCSRQPIFAKRPSRPNTCASA